MLRQLGDELGLEPVVHVLRDVVEQHRHRALVGDPEEVRLDRGLASSHSRSSAAERPGPRRRLTRRRRGNATRSGAVDSAPVPASSVRSAGTILRAASMRMRRSSSPSSGASPVEPATSTPESPAAMWARTLASNPAMSSDSSALNGVTMGPITPPKPTCHQVLPPSSNVRVRRGSSCRNFPGTCSS